MDSRAHVEAVCTIGRLLTPNIHKVTTLRSRRSRFSKPGFQIHCYEFLGFPQKNAIWVHSDSDSAIKLQHRGHVRHEQRHLRTDFQMVYQRH